MLDIAFVVPENQYYQYKRVISMMLELTNSDLSYELITMAWYNQEYGELSIEEAAKKISSRYTSVCYFATLTQREHKQYMATLKQVINYIVETKKNEQANNIRYNDTNVG